MYQDIWLGVIYLYFLQNLVLYIGKIAVLARFEDKFISHCMHLFFYKGFHLFADVNELTATLGTLADIVGSIQDPTIIGTLNTRINEGIQRTISETNIR